MSKRSPCEPHHTARTVADKAARADRLAAEMRKNLLKRKRQQRGQNEGDDGDGADSIEPDRPA